MKIISFRKGRQQDIPALADRVGGWGYFSFKQYKIHYGAVPGSAMTMPIHRLLYLTKLQAGDIYKNIGGISVTSRLAGVTQNDHLLWMIRADRKLFFQNTSLVVRVGDDYNHRIVLFCNQEVFRILRVVQDSAWVWPVELRGCDKNACERMITGKIWYKTNINWLKIYSQTGQHFWDRNSKRCCDVELVCYKSRIYFRRIQTKRLSEIADPARLSAKQL